MSKRKGFTLIELLGVIILLGVLALIVYPVVDSSIKQSRQKAYEQTVRSIENAAKMYVTNNKISTSSIYETLSLDELKKEGYLENEDLINPTNKKVMTGCVIYGWNADVNQFEYTYDEKCIPTTPTRCFTYQEKKYVKSFTIHYDNCVTFFGSETNEEIISLCQGNAVVGWTLKDIVNYFNKRDRGAPSNSLTDLINNNVISNIVYENGVEITDYDESCGSDIVLPNMLNGLVLKSIGELAFSPVVMVDAYDNNNNYNLVYNSPASMSKIYVTDAPTRYGYITSVDFSLTENLDVIDVGAFASNQIHTITFSEKNSITHIFEEAFCQNRLSSVLLPNSLKYIGGYAFAENNISNLELSDSLKYIEDSAFGDNNIRTLELPNGIEYLSGFERNRISSIVIPSSVKAIGYDAFEYNNLSQVVLNEGLEYIDSYAFRGNYLTSITIPNSVVDISNTAFINNNTLTSITVDNIYNAITGSPWGATGANINWLQSTPYTATLPEGVSISSNCSYNNSYYSGCVGVINSVNGKVTSYKLNGITQNGRNITIPEGNFTITDVITVPIFVLESPHPYSDNMNQTYTKTIEGANSLSLQFSAETLLETTHDKLKIYDKNNTLIGTYTGSQLSNKKLTVSGDTVKLVFTTDSSVTKYGFYVEIAKAS